MEAYVTQLWRALKIWAISTAALLAVSLFVAGAVKDVVTKGLKEQIEVLKAQNQRSIDDREKLHGQQERIQQSLDRLEKGIK